MADEPPPPGIPTSPAAGAPEDVGPPIIAVRLDSEGERGHEQPGSTEETQEGETTGQCFSGDNTETVAADPQDIAAVPSPHPPSGNTDDTKDTMLGVPSTRSALCPPSSRHTHEFLSRLADGPSHRTGADLERRHTFGDAMEAQGSPRQRSASSVERRVRIVGPLSKAPSREPVEAPDSVDKRHSCPTEQSQRRDDRTLDIGRPTSVKHVMHLGAGGSHVTEHMVVHHARGTNMESSAGTKKKGGIRISGGKGASGTVPPRRDLDPQAPIGRPFNVHHVLHVGVDKESPTGFTTSLARAELLMRANSSRDALQATRCEDKFFEAERLLEEFVQSLNPEKEKMKSSDRERIKAAVTKLVECIEMQPTHVAAHVYLAFAFFVLDEEQFAQKYIEAAEIIDPAHPVVEAFKAGPLRSVVRSAMEKKRMSGEYRKKSGFWFINRKKASTRTIPETSPATSGIPENVLRLVMTYLDPPDLSSVSAVCRLWRTVAARDDIWQSKVAERWPWEPKRREGSWKHVYMELDQGETKVADKAEIRQFVGLLSSRETMVQQRAVNAIATFALNGKNSVYLVERMALDPLCDLLSSPHVYVRMDSARAFANVAKYVRNRHLVFEAAAPEPLLSLMSDTDVEVQVQAARAVAEMCKHAPSVEIMLANGLVQSIFVLVRCEECRLHEIGVYLVRILVTLDHIHRFISSVDLAFLEKTLGVRQGDVWFLATLCLCAFCDHESNLQRVLEAHIDSQMMETVMSLDVMKAVDEEWIDLAFPCLFSVVTRLVPNSQSINILQTIAWMICNVSFRRKFNDVFFEEKSLASIPSLLECDSEAVQGFVTQALYNISNRADEEQIHLMKEYWLGLLKRFLTQTPGGPARDRAMSVVELIATRHRGLYPQPVHEGYLYKKSRVLNKWRLFWFSLGTSLSYSNSPHDKHNPRKLIWLSDIIGIETLDTKKMGRSNCFQFVTKHRTLNLAADSEAVMEGWLNAVAHRIAVQKRSSAAIPTPEKRSSKGDESEKQRPKSGGSGSGGM